MFRNKILSERRRRDYPVLSYPLIGLFFRLLSLIALAHENNVVHPGMTQEAIEAADISVIKERGYYSPGTDQCRCIDEGSVKEDHGNPLDIGWDTNLWGDSFCEVEMLSYQNHSYNPVTGKGWSIGGEDTVTYASPIWEQALNDHRSGNLDNAYFALGRVCHLLEDMSSPAHVHGDTHIFGDDFEDWGEERFITYSFDDVYPYIPSDSSIQGFLDALARFTYEFSSFQGELIESTETQPDSELFRMFPTLHYVDGGFWGGNYWEIDEVGRFETFVSDEWWPCDEDSQEEEHGGPGGDRRIIGKFYIENSAGDSGTLTPAVFEKSGLYEASHNTKPLVEIYGDVLYPKTISYVAGLFYVFTGETPPLDPPKNIRVVP